MTIGANEIRSNKDVKKRTSKVTVYRHGNEVGKMTQREIETTTYRPAEPKKEKKE